MVMNVAIFSDMIVQILWAIYEDEESVTTFS